MRCSPDVVFCCSVVVCTDAGRCRLCHQQYGASATLRERGVVEHGVVANLKMSATTTCLICRCGRTAAAVALISGTLKVSVGHLAKGQRFSLARHFVAFVFRQSPHHDLFDYTQYRRPPLGKAVTPPASTSSDGFPSYAMCRKGAYVACCCRQLGCDDTVLAACHTTHPPLLGCWERHGKCRSHSASWRKSRLAKPILTR